MTWYRLDWMRLSVTMMFCVVVYLVPAGLDAAQRDDDVQCGGLPGTGWTGCGSA